MYVSQESLLCDYGEFSMRKLFHLVGGWVGVGVGGVSVWCFVPETERDAEIECVCGVISDSFLGQFMSL